MSDRHADDGDLPILSFASADELEAWLRQNHRTSSGVWLRLFRTASASASVRFEEVLELGLAYGWSESQRRSYDRDSYLQRFTPRKGRGTTSQRNLTIVRRLISEGRMTDAGLAALGLTEKP